MGCFHLYVTEPGSLQWPTMTKDFFLILNSHTQGNWRDKNKKLLIFIKTKHRHRKKQTNNLNGISMF